VSSLGTFLDNAVILIVQEFYVSLQDHESRITEGHIWDTVLVRGKEVQEGVPMTSTEKLLKPSRSIIGDTLFQQYIKLRAKQLKDWNKQHQETTATPTLSKGSQLYTDMFESTNMGQEEEAHESEGEREEEEDGEDDEMDDEEAD
ncbi:hypothetical protein Gohar_013634, partial [Gossypium harknessii]|nr:hypothetical protein [Gossypium harknessii]